MLKMQEQALVTSEKGMECWWVGWPDDPITSAYNSHTHTWTFFKKPIYHIMIHFHIPQVMDSQIDSEALNNLLEDDMISLSGGELDTPNTDGNNQNDIHIIKPISILDELLASPPIDNSTNTTMSTSPSTISRPLYSIITTTTRHFATNIIDSNPTLLHQSTVTTLPTHTTPPSHSSCNTSPSPTYLNPPSTSTAKSKTTPSITQPEHLLFTFHSIPSHPNYISKLKLPIYIAKLCTDIQHNV